MTVYEVFSLDVLPDLPQSELLRQLAPDLWQTKGVVALWLGGSLPPVSRVLQEAPCGVKVMRVADAPTRTGAEIVAALGALHAHMAQVGREVARPYEFEYPEQLETVVLEAWEAFKDVHRN